MLRQRLECQVVQACVHQVLRRGERCVQRIEGRLARRQRFGVAHELEARVDGVANHVGEIVEIQRGEVLGAILQPERAEGPVERIDFALRAVDVTFQRSEARTLGQELPRGDAMREARVAALQEADGWRDRGAVAVEVIGKEARGCRVLLAGQGTHLHMDGLQAFHRQELEREADRQIRLVGVEARVIAGSR